MYNCQINTGKFFTKSWMIFSCRAWGEPKQNTHYAHMFYSETTLAFKHIHKYLTMRCLERLKTFEGIWKICSVNLHSCTVAGTQPTETDASVLIPGRPEH